MLFSGIVCLKMLEICVRLYIHTQKSARDICLVQSPCYIPNHSLNNNTNVRKPIITQAVMKTITLLGMYVCIVSMIVLRIKFS